MRYLSDIWKYKVFDNSWTKVGNMIYGKSAHTVLPVKGIKCRVKKTP